MFWDGTEVACVGECTAQTERCACDCMPVADLRAVSVDRADVKPEAEFRLLFRESCRKLIP